MFFSIVLELLMVPHTIREVAVELKSGETWLLTCRRGQGRKVSSTVIRYDSPSGGVLTHLVRLDAAGGDFPSYRFDHISLFQ